jgi:flagellar biosynthesis anti-sigma factor FlgM
MRVDIFNSAASQIASEQSSQQVSAQNAAKSGQTEDHATLTADSTSVGSLVNLALSSPEVRQNMVDNLRQSVSSGQYELDPGKIAASMVDDHV